MRGLNQNLLWNILWTRQDRRKEYKGQQIYGRWLSKKYRRVQN